MQFSGWKAQKADSQLAPVIPGLSDAGNCRDWKTGVPVDLKKIRAKDEDYWKAHTKAPRKRLFRSKQRKNYGETASDNRPRFVLMD